MSKACQYEKSCGAVVYSKNDGKIKYLLVCERSGFWVFPKGHMEEGETEHETALREIKEETGLDVTFIDGFRVKDEHNLAREGRPEAIKQTVYFLAEYKEQNVAAQASEISQILLTDYQSALNTLQLDSFKRILTQAHHFLEQSCPSSRLDRKTQPDCCGESK